MIVPTIHTVGSSLCEIVQLEYGRLSNIILGHPLDRLPCSHNDNTDLEEREVS
jgi:hypothetical protein